MRDARLGHTRWAVAGFAVLAGLLAGSLAGVGGWWRPVEARPKTTRWHSLEDALEQVRGKYLPALIVYRAPRPRLLVPEAEAVLGGGAVFDGGAVLDGEAPRDAKSEPDAKSDPDAKSEPDAFFQKELTDSRLRRVLRSYVLVLLEPKDLEGRYPLPANPLPEKAPAQAAAGQDLSVAAVLDLDPKRSAVVVLDLRERLIRRFEEDGRKAVDGSLPESTTGDGGGVPSLSRLQRDLARVAKVNAIFAKEARRVEPILEKARAGFRAGKVRAGVLAVRGLEGEEAQKSMDPVLKDRVTEVIGEFRNAAEEIFRSGEAFDRARQYFKAIQKFDRVMRDYPFKDISQRAVVRKGTILRKLRFGQ